MNLLIARLQGCILYVPLQLQGPNCLIQHTCTHIHTLCLCNYCFWRSDVYLRYRLGTVTQFHCMISVRMPKCRDGESFELCNMIQLLSPVLLFRKNGLFSRRGCTRNCWLRQGIYSEENTKVFSQVTMFFLFHVAIFTVSLWYCSSMFFGSYHHLQYLHLAAKHY